MTIVSWQLGNTHFIRCQSGMLFIYKVSSDNIHLSATFDNLTTSITGMRFNLSGDFLLAYSDSKRGAIRMVTFLYFSTI